MGLEGIIQMIALVRTITSQEDKAAAVSSGRVELWQKLQLLLITAMEWRHEDFEYAEEQHTVTGPPLTKEHILILANIMISNETSGHLRNPLILNYLFKSVFEMSEYSDDGYKNFNFEDIATLVDAFYKS